MTDLCHACNTNPARELPDPLLEGTVIMWSEGITGRALYCQSCFDEDDTDPDQP